MTDNQKRGDYLAGDTSGADLPSDERAVLDRIGGHLGDADLWEPPALDGQFRLLAAAAAENTSSTGADQVQPSPKPSPRPTPSPTQGPQDSDTTTRDKDSMVVELSDRRRNRRQRAIGLGAGLALAGAAAFVLITTGRLATAPVEDAQAPVTATYELAATALDPDTVASVDIRPTPSGVEFRLHLMGLDNAQGDDYYAAWLRGPDEVIPLGSFHWRKGGTTIVLWSGVDDVTYDQLIITRQVRGDGGSQSDEVVLMGEVPDLKAAE